jgi:hypothetical protein
MRTTKLTLSADKDLVAEAKKLSGNGGTSLSSMFMRFLQVVLSDRKRAEQAGPITMKATGLMKLPSGRNDRELLEEALAGNNGIRK